MSKVIYFASSFPHKSETFIVNQIIAAIAKGYEVDIMTYNYLSHSNTSQRDLFSKYHLHQKINEINYNIPTSTFLKLLTLIRLNIFYFKYIIRDKNLTFRKRFASLPFQIRFFKKYNSVGVFHVNFGYASFDIIKMKSLGVLNSKVIITFHGIDAHWLDKVDLVKKKNKYKKVFEFADLITVNSNYLKSKLIKLGCPETKVLILPMGVDVDYFKKNKRKYPESTKSFKLISIGRLIELKGHKYAIKAVGNLVKEGYEIEYYIIGEGKLREELNGLIKELALDKQVQLLGYKNQAEIKKILEDTDVFLMPSTKDKTGRGEAQGQVTAEAQSMGVPVIAFDSGGINETIIDGETGILIEDKDIASFSKAIKVLIDNEELRKEMGEKAEEFIRRRFNLKTNMDLLFNYY